VLLFALCCQTADIAEVTFGSHRSLGVLQNRFFSIFIAQKVVEKKHVESTVYVNQFLEAVERLPCFKSTACILHLFVYCL